MSITCASRRAVTAFAFLSALAAASPIARAQDKPVDALPVEYELKSPDDYKNWFSDVQKAIDPRWPDQVMQRYANDLEHGRHADVLAALADEFRNTNEQQVKPDELRKIKWPDHTNVTAPFQRRMDALAAAFKKAESEAEQSSTLETVAERDAVMAKINKDGFGVQSLLPEPVRPPGGGAGDLVLGFFADTPDQIITYRITPEGKYDLLVPVDLMRDLRLRAESVRRVLQDFVEPIQSHALTLIKRADRRWKNYLENGFSQYPWESFLNGRLWNFSAFDPPDQQLILLHPTVGIEVSTDNFDDMTANGALNVEMLGYVHYYGEDHENFFGGSIAATLRDRARPGIGFVAHWTKSFSVGLAWHDLDHNGNPFNDRPFVYLSFDLYRFLQSEDSTFKSEYDKVRALLPR